MQQNLKRAIVSLIEQDCVFYTPQARRALRARARGHPPPAPRRSASLPTPPYPRRSTSGKYGRKAPEYGRIYGISSSIGKLCYVSSPYSVKVLYVRISSVLPYNVRRSVLPRGLLAGPPRSLGALTAVRETRRPPTAWFQSLRARLVLGEQSCGRSS